jgi:hypothetical protein
MNEILSDLTVTFDCSIIHVVFGRCIFGSVNDDRIVRSAQIGWDQPNTAV